MTDPTTAPVPAASAELLTAVEAGRVEEIPGLLRPLDAAQRRACLPELKKMRVRLRTVPWSAPPEPQRHRLALYLAGVGCQSGAAAAVPWISAWELRWDADPWDQVMEILSDRGPEWMADLARRLADRRTSSAEVYPLVARLVRRSGCPVPTSDGTVLGWLQEMTVSREGTLADRLRSDRFTPHLIPRLFEVQDVGARLSRGPGPISRSDEHWPGALAALAEDGLLDRAVLLDGCAARLLRGERPSNLRGFLHVLDVLDPDEKELDARTGDWVRLVSEAPSPVAGRAQGILQRLWEAELLEAVRLAEATAGVLFRTEKALVRTQLILVGKALARDPADAGVLLPAVADGFGHADPDVQERALKLVAKHLGRVDAEVRSALAPAAQSLGSGLRERAAEVFGGTPEDRPAVPRYEESLPTVARPRPVEPPMATAYEVAEEVGAFLATDRGTAVEFERALDGLVRHAHGDRAELARALEPVVRRHPWITVQQGWWIREPLGLLGTAVGAVVGTAERRASLGTLLGTVQMPFTGPVAEPQPCPLQVYQDVMHRRTEELVRRMAEDPLPFLLATPTHDDGRIDPEVLLHRLREYRRKGVAVGAADFDQALLRVGSDGPAPEFAPDGAEERRLASWLTRITPPATVAERVVVDPPRPAGWPDDRSWRRRVMVGTGGPLELPDEFGAVFRALGTASVPTLRPCFHWGGRELHAAHWLAVLPGHRERLAVRLLHLVSDSATETSHGGALHLPALAEAGGPAGPALHLAVAYGFGARRPADRTAAVDAALVLAATGSLDAAALGRDLAELVALGTVKPNRFAESVRAAARTGAYRTVWSVLAAALPSLLAEDADHYGLGDLLAVAVDCVEQCGVSGTVPEVDRIAAAKGSSQLVRQARRLSAALATAPAAGSDG